MVGTTNQNNLTFLGSLTWEQMCINPYKNPNHHPLYNLIQISQQDKPKEDKNKLFFLRNFAYSHNDISPIGNIL